MDEIVQVPTVVQFPPTKVVPPKLADLLATTSQHQFGLERWADGNATHLLPVEVVTQIRAEVNGVLAQGCTPNQAAAAFAKLMACYPQPVRGGQDAADGYSAIMLEEMQRYPLPVLRQVLPDFYRTHAFRPAVAEICLACDEEVNKLHRVNRGLDRMERFRAEKLAKQAEEQDRREKAAAFAIEQDRRAVDTFAEAGVRAGDFVAADATFRLIQSSGYPSPWMRWFQLIPSNAQWPAWLGVPMAKAAIFGRTELALRRRSAAMDDLYEVHRMLIDCDDIDAARQKLDEIESLPVENPGASYEQPGGASAEVIMLADAFRFLLVEPEPARAAEETPVPAPGIDGLAANVELDPEPLRGPSEGADEFLARHAAWWERICGDEPSPAAG